MSGLKLAGHSASRNGQPSYRSSSPSSSFSSYTRGSNNVWPESFAIYFIREKFPLSAVTEFLNRGPFKSCKICHGSKMIRSQTRDDCPGLAVSCMRKNKTFWKSWWFQLNFKMACISGVNWKIQLSVELFLNSAHVYHFDRTFLDEYPCPSLFGWIHFSTSLWSCD